MNESKFEAELRRIQPTKPGPRLAERVAAELRSELALAPDRRLQPTTTRTAGVLGRVEGEPRSRSWNFWPGLGWALGVAAVAVAIVLVRIDFGQPTVAPADGTPHVTTIALNEEPDESVAELISTEDEGLVYEADDSHPQRQLRLTYLERHTWTNPESGAVIEFEVPREDVVWMPVAMQ